MDNVPLGQLAALLVFLITCSAFFSGSETALMALNRYRLRHLVVQKKPAALRTEALLRRPDRLLAVILLGNNIVNITATVVATVISLRLWGESGLAYGTAALTVVVLLFAEVAPKTLAAIRPERVAFPVSWVLTGLLVISYPLVMLINGFSNALLRLFGVSVTDTSGARLSREEVKTFLHESGGHQIHAGQLEMLLRIIDMSTVAVEDVMVPRPDLDVLDLDDPWEELREQIITSPYSRLPVCRDGIDNLMGLLKLRRVIGELNDEEASAALIEDHMQAAQFVPEGTSLTTQLLNFRKSRSHLAMVVNEYGEPMGVVTLEDLVVEIIGELSDKEPLLPGFVYSQSDGSYLVRANVNVRELNRRMDWSLPEEGAKTLNGQILEYLQEIPSVGTSMRLGGYPLEIVKTEESAVLMVRVHPDVAVLSESDSVR
ncbi:MAG: magnesium/cobalt efflux protein [Gammaproteobacteria bacterium]|nr:MAG: magnesium/cobalt efflux protein [Gammaproteobacteria bacterium]